MTLIKAHRVLMTATVREGLDLLKNLSLGVLLLGHRRGWLAVLTLL